jgi:hypothetical protein
VIYDELVSPLLKKIDEMRIGIARRAILLIENLDRDKRSAVDALIDDESHDLWDLSSFSLIFE